MITKSLQLELSKDIIPCRLVVRVTETVLTPKRGKGGLALVRSLQVQRRLSSGHDFMAEDITMIGGDALEKNIVNFRDVAPGLYTLITTNEHRDYETGIIDDYDYVLVPFQKIRK